MRVEVSGDEGRSRKLEDELSVGGGEKREERSIVGEFGAIR